MIRSTLVGAGAVTLVLGVGTLSYRAGQVNATTIPVAQPEGEVDMDAMMQMMAKAATPGEQHAQLAEAAGDWKAHTKFAMGPGEMTEGEATMSVGTILGGRFTKSSFEGEFAGDPFHGIGITGYDNVKQEYVSIWMDSFTTGIMYMTGQQKSEGIVFHGTTTNPMGETEMKLVTSQPKEGVMKDTFYEKHDGEWVFHGEITYTRVGHGMADD